MSKDMHPVPGLYNKVIRSVHQGNDDGGYSCLQIVFTDGTTLEALEQGQAGYFCVTIKEVTDPVCTCDYEHRDWHRDGCPAAIKE